MASAPVDPIPILKKPNDEERHMNRFESSSVASLPRMWVAPNTVFQYKDTALEAAHLEIGRLQNTNTLQQLLLDEATSRISDLAKYQDKAATIMARQNAKIRVLRKHERQEPPPTKDAGVSIAGVRGRHPELTHSGFAPSNQDVSRWLALDFAHNPSVPNSYSSRIGARPA
jgi:hypothetical protein